MTARRAVEVATMPIHLMRFQIESKWFKRLVAWFCVLNLNSSHCLVGLTRILLSLFSVTVYY